MDILRFGHRAFARRAADTGGLLPTTALVVLVAGAAWIYLLQSRLFAPFDPGDPANLCFAPRAAGDADLGALWLGARRMLIEGAVMVFAMMTPGAARAALEFGARPAVVRTRGAAAQRWFEQASWLGGYLAVWCGAITALVVVASMGRLAFAASAPAALALGQVGQFGPALLAALAGAGLLWRAGANPRAARRHVACRAEPLQRPHLCERSIVEAWHDGWRAGLLCVGRCGPTMLALHAVGAMTLVVMAACAASAWWWVDSHSRAVHAAAGGALLVLAVISWVARSN
jgi:predicted metal-binding membrane protein